MKPGAVIFEVFPYKYFKRSYIFLSKQYGIHHRMTQNVNPTSWSRQGLVLLNQSYCMKYRRCRSFARGDAVIMSNDHVEDVINTMNDIENKVLGCHNAPYVFKTWCDPWDYDCIGLNHRNYLNCSHGLDNPYNWCLKVLPVLVVKVIHSCHFRVFHHTVASYLLCACMSYCSAW